MRIGDQGKLSCAVKGEEQFDSRCNSTYPCNSQLTAVQAFLLLSSLTYMELHIYVTFMLAHTHAKKNRRSWMTGLCRKGEHENSLQLQGEESLCEFLTFTCACILGVFMRTGIIYQCFTAGELQGWRKVMKDSGSVRCWKLSSKANEILCSFCIFILQALLLMPL